MGKITNLNNSKKNFNNKDKTIKKTFLEFSDKNPATFAGINNVYNTAKKHVKNISRDDVVKYLEGERTYTQHKPRRLTRYERLAYIPTGLNSDWQADLADFQKLKTKNKGFAFLLVCIDVLSRKVYAEPIKSKSFIDVKKGFDVIFKKAKTTPLKLTTDRGREFESRQMKEYFENKGILKRVIYSPDIHAGVVERMNRTIKERLYRYFTHYEINIWINVIEKIVSAINNSINRTIGMPPNNVNGKNYKEILENIFIPRQKQQTDKKAENTKYKEGDFVHIDKEKGKFEKGYTKNYTEEIFRIKKVKQTKPIHYKIEDLNGEDILGVFYSENLSKVKLHPNSRISEIIKEKQRKDGKKEYLVHWIGEKKDEWVVANTKKYLIVD